MSGAVVTANLNNFDLLPNGNNGFTTSNLQASAHVFGPYVVQAAHNRAITERLMNESRGNSNHSGRRNRRPGGFDTSSSSSSSSSSGSGAALRDDIARMSQPASRGNSSAPRMPPSGNRGRRRGGRNQSRVMVPSPPASQPPPAAPPSVAPPGASPSWATTRSNSAAGTHIPAVHRQSTSSSVAPNRGMSPAINVAPNPGRHPLQRERSDSARSVHDDARPSIRARNHNSKVARKVARYDGLARQSTTQPTAFLPFYEQQRGLLGQIRP